MSDSGYQQGHLVYVLNAGAEVVVRRHGHALGLHEEDGQTIDVKVRIKGITNGESQSLWGWVNLPGKGQQVYVHVVVLRLPKEQAARARAAKAARIKAKGKSRVKTCCGGPNGS